MYNYKSKMLRVVDGDTVDVEMDLGFGVFMKTRVRLMGIDTPESRTRNLAEKSWGLAAKKRLQSLLEDKELVLQTKLQKKGKFGRVLGTLKTIKDEIDINQLLVLEGLAIPYEGGNKEDARKKHGVLELWNTHRT